MDVNQPKIRGDGPEKLYFVKMPRKCCVPCCRSNYKTETTLTSTFGFPKDEELKKKWISSINRKDYLPGSTAAVCINHFDEQHIIWEDRIPQKDGSTYTIERKRPKLVDGAYPTKFPNQPHYLSEDLPKTRKSPSLRRAKEITRAENQFSEWCEADNIKSLNEIKENVAEKVKDPWQHTLKENSIFIYKIETSDCPKEMI
ncbi:hypothetical protein JTE90_026554 [Oedothorax gibbosus]|uniref:THAP-type domain-containing protein n=1 Tax=Oedothorax gibbosus TaxID=931172 RepID=A0AAV6U2M0_9ARAC|nr:hypothetical protein JTE90_026554 [Oedothorax gibbosus]